MQPYCYILSGSGLTKEGQTVMYAASVQMFRKGNKRLVIEHDEFQFVITTQFNFSAVGSISGCLFQAEIESNQGSSRYKYLVRDWDLNVPLLPEFWVTAEEWGRTTHSAANN